MFLRLNQVRNRRASSARHPYSSGLRHNGEWMRRIALPCLLAVAVSGPTPRLLRSAEPMSSVDIAFQNDGKIPITTSSEQARGLYLRARALSETLKPHEAHALFAQAVAI